MGLLPLDLPCTGRFRFTHHGASLRIVDPNSTRQWEVDPSAFDPALVAKHERAAIDRAVASKIPARVKEDPAKKRQARLRARAYRERRRAKRTNVPEQRDAASGASGNTSEIQPDFAIPNVTLRSGSDTFFNQ